MYTRRKTKKIHVGNIGIGGDEPVSIQSMITTDTRDTVASVKQISELAKAGCEIVRLAVVDLEAAHALKTIIGKSSLPLIADIHFDHKLALASMEAGVQGLRINPGNIGSKDKIRQVVDMAKDLKVPIRIGVNSGSVEKELLERYHGPTTEAMVESALNHMRILEDMNFTDIKLSIKSSDVSTMIEANRLLANRCHYPLHIGVTEAGLKEQSLVKSSIGIGTLLAEGIGDTIRVSITGNPVDEVKAARDILSALNLRCFGPTLVSCPTCGRTEVDLIGLAEKVQSILHEIDIPIKVAVMGCAVNGPGEAREADLGIAGGKNLGLIFRKGKIIRKVRQEELIPAFKKELEILLKEME
ncbi:flavodoxin-dependent (E)-4-hydroxy-3-methylbut-2-enyl-diphosphate synthase [Clostridia bacterium]|nr:flavodoxin-dependent (E)-4-hydroxy-3-methylbut-2-enyl-diphosphate synthase [Clostridia bacterium]